MKNITKKIALLLILSTLMATRCVSDSEEQTVDEEQVGKAKGEKQANLDAVYGTTSYNLETLKVQLLDRDAEFTKELKQYNDSVDIKNEKFKESFLREALKLNKLLEQTISE